MTPGTAAAEARRWAVGGLFALGAIAAVRGEPVAPASGVDLGLDPARIGWSELRMRARKLALTASSDVRVETISAGEAKAALVSLPQAAGCPATEPTVLVTIESAGLGRRALTEAWIDPADAAALQRRELESGHGRDRLKLYRYGSGGVFSRRTRPAPGEADRPPESWSAVTESFDELPAATRSHGALSDPSALFYLLAAAPLERTGDRVVVPIYTRGKVVLAELAVRGVSRIEVDYTEESATGERRVRGTADALRVGISGSLLEPRGSAGEDLEFLGLHGDVEVFLDAATRVPLEVTGRLQVVGRTHVRLERVRLSAADGRAAEREHS